MRNTTTRTFSINDEIYKEFIKIIKEKDINKSKLIEKFIIQFVNENK
jgi:metal-responsive CopG/Arc/MetJ family transcriptional regulator